MVAIRRPHPKPQITCCGPADISLSKRAASVFIQSQNTSVAVEPGEERLKNT